MDWLQERGEIVPASRQEGPGNSLVLVAPRDTPFEWSPESPVPLPELFAGRLAIADPSHVPAGMYAREALEHAGWWNDLERRVVATLDVRAALTLVERGECDAGIVYGSDASSSGRCRIVAVLPETWHEPIRYVAAIVTGADTTRAQAWLDAFASPVARQALQAHGFRAIGRSDAP
jgi:molybdate transport system substrate-binding protein